MRIFGNREAFTKCFVGVKVPGGPPAPGEGVGFSPILPDPRNPEIDTDWKKIDRGCES